MALDPMSALSLAAAVVQFVDFSSKLVSKGYQIYQSANGALPENLELEAISRDLSLINVKLRAKKSSGPMTQDQESLESLSNDCTKMADELLGRLEKLKVTADTKHRKLKSFRQALKTVWNKQALDEMSSRLKDLRAQLEFHVLLSLKENNDLRALEQSDRFDALEVSTKILLQTLNENRTPFTDEFKTQSLVITKLHRDMKDHVSNEHAHTRSLITQAIRESRNDKMVSGTSIDATLAPDEIQAKQAQAHVLQSLSFETMRDRYDNVTEAHQRTFDWIFHENIDEETIWSNFNEWLREGQGIYWINGKAGSGKSTLMRHIVENERTQTLLEQWAEQPNRLIIADFFFWKSGARDQASQPGLLRSLLFEILSERPSLISTVFPEECAKSHEFLSSHRIIKERQLRRWTLAKLREGFRSLLRHDIGKICLFIDGLDEYEGDLFDTIEFFTSITSPNLKICVSSRPWVVFENAFRACCKLKLQDLTRHDIQMYVNDKLLNDARMQRLYILEPEEAPKLILEIVVKADGIFLWVMLVVRSLLNGLTNSDTTSDLQKRLKLIPSSIEALYTNMLAQIEPLYFEEGSRIFQIMSTVYDFFCKSTSEVILSAIGFSFALERDPYVALKYPDDLLSEAQVKDKVQCIDHKLRVCCAGILELSNKKTSQRPEERKNVTVEYIHRTAKDFLYTPETRSKIFKATFGTGFDPHASLFRSHIMLFKTCLMDCFEGNILYDTFQLASFMERGTGRASHELLDELDRILAQRLLYLKTTRYGKDLMDTKGDRVDCWGDQFLIPDWSRGAAHNDMLAVAINYMLNSYVASKLESHSNLLKQKIGRPYLDYAVRPINRNYFIADPQMVALLFKHGADPNEMCDRESVWQNMLSRAIQHGFGKDRSAKVSVLELFLNNGADPQAYIEPNRRKGKLYVPDVIREAFSDYPEDVERLLALWSRRLDLVNRQKNWRSVRSRLLSRFRKQE